MQNLETHGGKVGRIKVGGKGGRRASEGEHRSRLRDKCIIAETGYIKPSSKVPGKGSGI